MIRCLLCREPANLAPDPRLPLLRIPVCSDCKDRIAIDVGWTQALRPGRRGRKWFRHGAIVEVPT